MEQSIEPGEPSDGDVRRSICEAGWERGMTFRAAGLRLHAHGFTESSGGILVPIPHETSSDGRWVVVSQTCDIVAPLDKEPVVEAFPCSIEEDKGARAHLRRSYRGFEIDPGTHLVARSAVRLTVGKRSLARVDPEPWPGSSDLLAKFSKWLGLRISRDAIPDEIDRPFLGPLRSTLERHRTGGRDRRATYAAFNDAVKEVRIWRPERGDPPYTIPVTLIVESDVSAEQSDAIEQVLGLWREAVDPTVATMGPTRLLTTDRISLEELDRTWLVDLFAESYDGAAAIGARPVQY